MIDCKKTTIRIDKDKMKSDCEVVREFHNNIDSIHLYHPELQEYRTIGKDNLCFKISSASIRSVPSVAADGSVMISKVVNGQNKIELKMDKSSDLNKWLENWSSHLKTAPSSTRLSTTITTADTFLSGISLIGRYLKSEHVFWMLGFKQQA